MYFLGESIEMQSGRAVCEVRVLVQRCKKQRHLHLGHLADAFIQSNLH